MKHEPWIENENGQTICLTGSHRDSARSLLDPGAKLPSACEASSHFEAMTKYYEYMRWGDYKSDSPEQAKKTYSELGWE